MRFILPLLTLGILLIGCGTKSVSIVSPDGTNMVSVGVEVADEPAEQQRGLMGRTTLGENSGMFFIFDEPQILSFWMKDTLIPLEIHFFDVDGYFINALTMEPCTKDPCPGYKSASLAKYALEVNPGFREANGISTGWRLDPATLEAVSK